MRTSSAEQHCETVQELEVPVNPLSVAQNSNTYPTKQRNVVGNDLCIDGIPHLGRTRLRAALIALNVDRFADFVCAGLGHFNLKEDNKPDAHAEALPCV